MTGTPPSVVYWTGAPSPHTVRRLNAVARSGEISIEAWFSSSSYADRSWLVPVEEMRFPWRVVESTRFLRWRIPVPVQELSEARPDLVIQEYDRLFFVVGFLVARAAARRSAFRALPNFDLVSQRTWWREIGKHFVFRSVDAAKVPGATGAALVEKYGLPGDRAHRVTQSADVAHFRQARDVAPADRERGRERLGLEGCTFLFVGRLLRTKGLEDLFDAFARLQTLPDATSLLVVGDGEEQALFQRRAAALRGIRLIGFIQAAELPHYYSLADVFVFPSHGDAYGLVVDEALAAGLPVISTADVGDIRDRLEAFEAGLVVPATDPNALADAMASLATDPARRAEIKANTWRAIAAHTDEQYAADFIQFVLATLAKPRRSGAAAHAASIAGQALIAGAKLPARIRARTRAGVLGFRRRDGGPGG